MRALSSDHVDLGETTQLVLTHGVVDQLLRRVRVGLRLLPCDCEGAELALHTADVGLVQIEVLDEEDAIVSAAYAPREVGQLSEREDVVRLHQGDAVLEVETLSRFDLVADGAECVRAFEQSHYFSRSTTA